MDIADQSDDVMRQRRAQKTVEVLRMLRGSGGGKRYFCQVYVWLLRRVSQCRQDPGSGFAADPSLRVSDKWDGLSHWGFEVSN